MQPANPIIEYSKVLFCIISSPNTGRLVKNKGNTAQCMAQANDADIPNVSRLIFFANAPGMKQKYWFATWLQNYFC